MNAKVKYSLGGTVKFEQHEGPKITFNMDPTGMTIVEITNVLGKGIKVLGYRKVHWIEVTH